MTQQEIVIYKPSDDISSQIEVRIEEETVWLSQAQMVELFAATKQNISLHINNVFKERELDEKATVKYSLTVQKEGNRTVKRKVLLYNLDVIISVGYRVKSQRGTQFRIWANRILKDYLLKGYVIHQRIDRIEKKVLQHEQQIEALVNTALPPKEGIFYDGQVFDAYSFVSGIIKSAKKSIILIDNYIDETVLILLSKRKKDVAVKMFTKNISKQLQLDVTKYNAQYGNIEVVGFSKSHDRFLIIDQQVVYHIGASLKDLGKKWFAFSKIMLDSRQLIAQLNKTD
ncbi:MAG: virulence RhuM family protein [Bacteroidetes bacterium]|nr:virulence RhuM family protein [Bacteroidota bacterium]